MDERIVPNSAPTAFNVATTGHGTQSVSIDATDPENDALSVVFVGTASNGTVALDGSILTYTPNGTFVGTETVDYSVSDGEFTSTAEATFTVTNQVPTVTNYDLYCYKNTSATITPTVTDGDGDTVTITGVSTVANGTVTHTGNTIVFTPTTGYAGVVTLTYTATDSYNGNATGTITVHVLNQPPVPMNYEFTAHAGNTVVIMPELLCDPDGDYTTIVGVGSPGYGTATITGNYIVYTPTTGYVGIESFNYVLTDGQDSGTGTITITFTNTAPTASTSTINATRGETLTGNVLTGATDADGDNLTATVLTNPAHGTLTLNPNGTYSYEPASNYLGSESFQIAISDGNGGSVTKTVNLIIADEYGNLTEPPVAEDVIIDRYTGEELEIYWKASNVDPNGGTITLYSVSHGNSILSASSNGTLTTSHGTVHIGENGRPIYTTDDEEWEGTDTFSYCVVNILGAVSPPMTMSVNRKPNPKAPPEVIVDFAPLAGQDGNIAPGTTIQLIFKAGNEEYNKTYTTGENDTPKTVAQEFDNLTANSGWLFKLDGQGKLSVKRCNNTSVEKYKCWSYNIVTVAGPIPIPAPVATAVQPGILVQGNPIEPTPIE